MESAIDAQVTIHWLDWSIIGAYILFALAVSIYFSKRAGKNIIEYFLTGRSLPWWLLGTSMVATSFASDTPLAVSGLVAKKGIAGNWYWWCWGFVFMFTALFIARLWRRTGVITDAEYYELRYSGGPARLLRAFRAGYYGLIVNCIILGWVMHAMVKVLRLSLGWEREYEWVAIGILFAITVTYTFMSGLWGVVITDFVQFAFAMFGSILLAVICLVKLGGMQAIIGRISEIYGPTRAMDTVAIVPRVDTSLEPFSAFLIYIFILWWSSGSTDGAGGVSQRFLSAKNQAHAALSAVWFVIAHICLRSWPWIIVGLAAMVVFPYLPDANGVLPDAEAGYPKIMLSFLPLGLKGIMLASFFAAFMSTVDTGLNWGSSLLVNDLYKRFFRRTAPDKHYVRAARGAVIIIALTTVVATIFTSSIEGAWKYLSNITVGIGAIYLLRWLWWRINAWSEISAMVTSLLVTNLLMIFGKALQLTIFGFPAHEFPYSLVVTLCISLPVALLVTFLTRPVDEQHLIKFYKKVRPPGRLWKRIYQKVPGVKPEMLSGRYWLIYLVSLVCVYSALVGTGQLLFGRYIGGIVLLVVAIIAGVAVFHFVSRVPELIETDSDEKGEQSFEKTS